MSTKYLYDFSAEEKNKHPHALMKHVTDQKTRALMNKDELHCKNTVHSISYVTSPNFVAFFTPAIQTTQYIKNNVVNTEFGTNFELHPSDDIIKL